MKKRLHTRILTSFLLVVAVCCSVKAQYNNEWIDYGKVYYKFKVGSDGLYRIPFATLQANGLQATRAEHFQLWRNGKEVPLFTSVASGSLGVADFLEFYGKMNDGSLDAVLYKKPEFQLADKWSLQTDTSCYFLTVNTASPNARMLSATNDVAGNTLAPDPFFMYTFSNFYRDQINPGYAALVGSYVYSSSYDNGEGWTSRSVQVASPIIDQRRDLFVASANVNATLSVSAYGNALNARRLQVYVNGSMLVDQPMINFTAANRTVNFASSVLGRATDTVRIVNSTTVGSDRLVVAKYALTYPRQFNFGGASVFEFSLPSSATGNFLEISNFSNGAVPPVLYDVTSSRRYTGDIQVTGKIRFALPPGAARDFVLLSTAGGAVQTVSSIQRRQFVNYAATANQGNYFIISHGSIAQSKNGNALENYRAYRSSAIGGSYQARIYDVDELEDQFAFGVKKHPLSVKNFLRFARKNFSIAAKYILLVGKSITYDQYRANESRAITARISLVPTFGNPGSDNLLVSENLDPVPATAVGRLSVVSGDELNDYLDKIRQHDQAIASPSQTVKDKAWMKNIAHIVGGGDPYLQTVIDGYMNAAKTIAEDTAYGARVFTFNKITPSGLELVNSGALNALFSEGLGLITYFGHSSANNMEFNLDDPSIFNNIGKYPLFIANGCNAGNFFIYDTLRFTRSNMTITEDYTLIPQKGSIGFISSTHFGIVNYLNLYTNNFYKRFSRINYPSTVGESQLGAIKDVVAIGGVDDFYNLITAEQVLLGGDPAVKFNSFNLPDYAIEDPQVTVGPTPLSVANAVFDLKAKYFNLGRATQDSIRVLVRHELPDGTIKILHDRKRIAAKNTDSIIVSVPIDAARFKGQNKVFVSLDPDNSLNEISNSNNSLIKSFSISEDEVKTSYPLNFAIVNRSPVKLIATTVQFLRSPALFLLEVDTTEMFNSAAKVKLSQSSQGGVIEFSPVLQLRDSTVFYWRVAKKPDTGVVQKWSASSFVYLSRSSTGWNQSHYFQNLTQKGMAMYIDGSRNYAFSQVDHSLRVNSGILPVSQNAVYSNLDNITPRFCVPSLGSFELVLIDLKTNRPFSNYPVGSKGRFNSDFYPACAQSIPNQFWFSYNNASSRKSAMDFIDSIPPETMVVWSNISAASTRFENINSWMSDTLLYGKNNSIYHRLKALGVGVIDSLKSLRPFYFIIHKDASGRLRVVDQQVGANAQDIVSGSTLYKTPGSTGKLETPLIGPAKSWESVHWNGNSLERFSKDEIRFHVYGLDNNFNQVLLFSSAKKQIDTAISSIDARRYPYMRIVQENTDTLSLTPFQLSYLQVKYRPVPEGALMTDSAIALKDTLEIGEPIRYSISYKNISDVPFDSVKVLMTFTDAANITKTLLNNNKKPLQSGDSILLNYEFDTKSSTGFHSIYVNFNPDGIQPEQYLFNNYFTSNYHVMPDKYPPNIDVTFDGVHILNKDIVSARPQILIRLKDDNKYLQLNDTGLIRIQLRYPDGVVRTFRFNNDTIQFVPSSSISGQGPNELSVLFKPHLIYDGEYELVVTGKDRSNNQSGSIAYRVVFEVVNKSMITQLLNYPNPFTSSTAFVFTLTGSVLPTNFKIQVLTVTGKVVREITQQEIGPVRIGNNITDYKWDGCDQFGQPLANGVYLYRVVADIQGKKIEKLENESLKTSKYFQSGYGKMYLMR